MTFFIINIYFEAALELAGIRDFSSIYYYYLLLFDNYQRDQANQDGYYRRDQANQDGYYRRDQANQDGYYQRD